MGVACFSFPHKRWEGRISVLLANMGRPEKNVTRWRCVVSSNFVCGCQCHVVSRRSPKATGSTLHAFSFPAGCWHGARDLAFPLAPRLFVSPTRVSLTSPHPTFPHQTIRNATQAVMADDVRARKLQPIYNALDARNYKMAVKLCAKKDLEKWDIVKTLKAHALERMGRVEEALDLCREVQARKPTDETVLNTLVLTYKLTGQTTEATACYEAAAAAQPAHEEYGRELFFCYVRQRAYAKAQQLATRLYKQFTKDMYLFWAGAAMRLGVGKGGGGSPMLALAERMVEKGLVARCGGVGGEDGAMAPSAEELELYVLLLEEQGQVEKALEALKTWGERYVFLLYGLR